MREPDSVPPVSDRLVRTRMWREAKPLTGEAARRADRAPEWAGRTSQQAEPPHRTKTNECPVGAERGGAFAASEA